MKDAKITLEKLLTQASECEMIAHLTTVEEKRITFERLAASYRTMATDLQTLIDSGRLAAG